MATEQTLPLKIEFGWFGSAQLHAQRGFWVVKMIWQYHRLLGTHMTHCSAIVMGLLSLSGGSWLGQLGLVGIGTEVIKKYFRQHFA